MKVLLLLGSRNPQGQTAQAAGALVRGAASRGAAIETFHLPQMALERCRQCNSNGWGTCRTEGRCVIEDDLALLMAKMQEADAIVFATPVYFADLSESMRTLLDRVRRIAQHRADGAGLAGKPAVGLCVAGGGGGGAPRCCLRLDEILSTIGLDLVDMWPVRRQNLEAKLPLLEQAGAWLAELPSQD